VLVHGYDPPPGGKWIDDVIPGKLSAIERHEGELLWQAPCEVGYGRGFAAGFGALGQAVVLGPSTHGHRMVRMSLGDGELLEAADISPFDEASVASDLCLCVSAQRVFALDSLTLGETWEYSQDGERYHHVARSGDRVLAIYTHLASGLQGVLVLSAHTGEYQGVLLAPTLSVIHDVSATGGVVVLLTCELDRALGPRQDAALATAIALHEGGGVRDTLSLLGLGAGGRPGDPPLWFQVLETRAVDELPDVAIAADGGKLYVERGAMLDAMDALSGRTLGGWTVPGLDQQVDWCVVEGAGLLAEETRVSVFELPA